MNILAPSSVICSLHLTIQIYLLNYGDWDFIRASNATTVASVPSIMDALGSILKRGEWCDGTGAPPLASISNAVHTAQKIYMGRNISEPPSDDDAFQEAMALLDQIQEYKRKE